MLGPMQHQPLSKLVVRSGMNVIASVGFDHGSRNPVHDLAIEVLKTGPDPKRRFDRHLPFSLSSNF